MNNEIQISHFSVILVSVTLLASWTVPTLVQKMTDDSHSYPLMYYSARLKELCVIDFREHKNSFYDIHGNEYPRAQYDSLLPLLNYRQLAMEGQLPDSLEGQAIDVKILRSKQVMFRFVRSMYSLRNPLWGCCWKPCPNGEILRFPVTTSGWTVS